MRYLDRIILLILISPFITGLIKAQSGYSDLPDRGLCAHRGAMDTYPENTLVAFQAAIDQGAHMIEFDVHITADQKLVIIHDDSIDRTTNGHGQVAEKTLGELKKLDAGSWMHDKFKGEQVPTLSETLSMMPLNIWLNVHLKDAPGIGGLVAEEIVRHDRLHQSFLACTREAAIEAKNIESKINICNMDRQESTWDYVHMTVDLNAEFIQLKGVIAPAYREFVQYLKTHGVKINYFGTDQAAEISLLFEYGVDFPLVNNIEASIEISSNLGIFPVTPVYRRKK